MNQTEYTPVAFGSDKYTFKSGFRKHLVESLGPRPSNDDEVKRAEKRATYIAGTSDNFPVSPKLIFDPYYPFHWIYLAVSGLRGLIQRDVDLYAIEREEKIQAKQTDYVNKRIATAKPTSVEEIENVRRNAVSEYKNLTADEIHKSKRRAQIIKGIWAVVFVVPEAVSFAIAHPWEALKGTGELIVTGLTKLFPSLAKKKNAAARYARSMERSESKSTRDVNRTLNMNRTRSKIEMCNITKNISRSPGGHAPVPTVVSSTLVSSSSETTSLAQQESVSQERKDSEHSSSLANAEQEAVSAARVAASATQVVSPDEIELKETASNPVLTGPAPVLTIHGRKQPSAVTLHRPAKRKPNVVTTHSGSVTVIRGKQAKSQHMDNDMEDPDSVIRFHPNPQEHGK